MNGPDPQRTAMQAAFARGMVFKRGSTPDLALIVCKVCGWPHGESVIVKYAKEPFGCPDHPVRKS